MKWDIPGYLRNTSNQTLFLSEALRFCKLTFSESEDFLHFVIHHSGRIFLLFWTDELQMRILSAKLGCIGQAVSGKLRVTLTQQLQQWDGVFLVLRPTFRVEICQAPIKDHIWTKNHLLTMTKLSQPNRHTMQMLSYLLFKKVNMLFRVWIMILHSF